MHISSDPARLAVELAALGWHILPLSPVSKRPLGNCGACRPRHGIAAHLAGACPCLAVGGWCHGVRAATTDPATITAWWHRQPRAVPGVAAGPSGLVLVDIDAHGGPPRPRPTWPPACCPASTSRPSPSRPARGPTRPGSGTAATAWPCWPGSAAAPAPGPPGQSTSPSSRPPPPTGCTCGTGPPPPTSARPSATPTARTGWPGKSTSKPAGPTASPPARPPPPAPTRSAAATLTHAASQGEMRWQSQRSDSGYGKSMPMCGASNNSKWITWSATPASRSAVRNAATPMSRNHSSLAPASIQIACIDRRHSVLRNHPDWVPRHRRQTSARSTELPGRTTVPL